MYADEIGAHVTGYDSAYNSVTWFTRDCYYCNQMNLPSLLLNVSSSASPSSTTSPIVTYPPLLSAPSTFPIPPYTASTCSRSPGQAACILSGSPLQTQGAIAAVVNVPRYSFMEETKAYESCAGVCSALQGCRAFALDRTPGKAPGDTWTCYTFAEDVSLYTSAGSQLAYRDIVWFNASCYDCVAYELAVPWMSFAPVPSTSSPSSPSSVIFESATATTTVSTTEPSANDVSTVVSAGPTSASTSGRPPAAASSTDTAVSTTFTSTGAGAASVTVTSAPVPVQPQDLFAGLPVIPVPAPTPSTCRYPTADPSFYRFGCAMSVAPVASNEALVARATGIPVPAVLRRTPGLCRYLCRSRACDMWQLGAGS